MKEKIVALLGSREAAIAHVRELYQDEKYAGMVQLDELTGPTGVKHLPVQNEWDLWGREFVGMRTLPGYERDEALERAVFSRIK